MPLASTRVTPPLPSTSSTSSGRMKAAVSSSRPMPTAKGGVASAWMLAEMQSRHKAPLAIVFNTVNPILAQGVALANITMLSGFEKDVTALIPHGATVEIDPSKRTLRVV